jgi:hypothetical protein
MRGGNRIAGQYLLPDTEGVTIVEDEVELDPVLIGFVHEHVDLVEDAVLVVPHRPFLKVRCVLCRRTLGSAIHVDDPRSHHVDVGGPQGTQVRLAV